MYCGVTKVKNKQKETFLRKRAVEPHLLNYASRNRDSGRFNDITVIVGSHCIHANRMVLSCCSKYFDAMFQTEMKEKYEKSVEIKELDGASVRSVIDYFYSGNITIGDENFMDLLAVADFFQVEEVKKFCFDHLESFINIETCFSVFRAAALYRYEFRENDPISKFFSDNVDKVLQSESITAMSKADLIVFLSKLKRERRYETFVFDALVSWTKHDLEERKHFFYDLLKLVKFENLSSEFLESTVSKEELVKSNLNCSHLLSESLITLLKEKHSKNIIISVGGIESRGRITEEYSCRKNTALISFPMLPKTVLECCALQQNNVIYCINSCNTARSLITPVWKMELSKDDIKWIVLSPLNQRRSRQAAASFKDTLVVAGGAVGDEVIATAEVYISFLDEWRIIKSMACGRKEHALVACGNFLYALGGDNGAASLSSVECLKNLKENWIVASPMQAERTELAAVSCGDVIYAIGGRSGLKKDSPPLKSVEKYDPVEEEWNYICDTNIGRYGHSACVLNGKIFVSGGKNANSVAVKEIECYDPSNNLWTVVGTMNQPLYKHSLVVV